MALFKPKIKAIKILSTICGYGVINIGFWFAAKEIINQEKSKKPQAAQNITPTFLNKTKIPRWTP